MALGYQHWSTLSDLKPEVGGSFDSGGIALDASVHWRLNRFADRRILIGLQAGAATDYSSDIDAFVGDLRASTGYAGTSALFSIAENGFIEFGLGTYRVTIRDSRVHGTSGLFPPGSPSSNVHEQRDFGIFIGGGVELATSDRGALTIGAKLHSPDFGEVHELGSRTGSLSGPMLTVQFGLRYIR